MAERQPERSVQRITTAPTHLRQNGTEYFMIITYLRATNVLKYARLELNKLPSKGLIAITGPNESGKTAVVEAVCFALFGRTFSHGEADLPKLIHWGEESCRIEMGFEAGDGVHYRVSRTLDQSGVHGAELYRAEEKTPFATGPNTVRDAVAGICGFDYQQYLDALYLAQMEISAPHSQSDTIREIAGTRELEAVAAELEREIQTHRAEIEATERHLESLRTRIAALEADEQAMGRLESEAQALRSAMQERRGMLETLRELSEELRELGADLRQEIGELTQLDTQTPLMQWRTELEALEQAAGKIATACQAIETEVSLCSDAPLQARVADLRARLAEVDRLEQRIEGVRHRMGVLAGTVNVPAEESHEEPPIPAQIAALRARLLGPRLLRSLVGMVFLLAALAALGLWGLWWLAQPAIPGALADGVFQWLGSVWSAGVRADAQWAFIAALITTGLAAVTWLWAVTLDRRIKGHLDEIRALETRRSTLLKKLGQLGELEAAPLSGIVETLRRLEEPELDQALSELEQGPASVFLSQELLRDYLSDWTRLGAEIEIDIADLREAIAERVGQMEQQIQSDERTLEAIDGQRRALEEKRGRIQSLMAQVRELEPRIAEHEQAVRVRELALDLTRGTCRSIYQRFNNVLSKFTGEVLPKFTEGRYQRLQISEDLKLRVFVADKNDFAELEELSSGTQRQILLAVRLAMAKALVDASGERRQFIVLDEPFAFFDRERIQLTLRALPELDRRITQVWIISQEFAAYDRFKLNIRCSRDADELVIGEKGKASLFSPRARPEPT
ncbi:MAG TPA: SMC family ATPase [Chromatiales bacterium]|nr:SMC family ATPase [Chromatiales bacterium]